MAVNVYVKAFEDYIRGDIPQAAQSDGCALIAGLKVPLTVTEAKAVLGAFAVDADFSTCLDRAARYIAVALANIPGSAVVLKEKLRKLIVELEDRGLHREAFVIAIAGARSGSPSLLAHVTPRGWAEEVLYTEVVADVMKGAIDKEVFVDLEEYATIAALDACSAGPAPCRYAKASLYSRLAGYLASKGEVEGAEEYIEMALKAFEELGFDARELGGYLDLLYPLGWGEASAKTVMDYLTLIVFSVAANIYRAKSDDEKMFAYIEELYRRTRGTKFELATQFTWARFAYALGRISLDEMAKTVEDIYAKMLAKSFVGADPFFASRFLALYASLLAAMGRGEEAVRLYDAYARAVHPTSRYLAASYLALLGLIDHVGDKVRRDAALALQPPSEVRTCINAGLCPPESILVGREDTAAALTFDLVARGRHEEALEIVYKYLEARKSKAAELWDAVAIALKGGDREALKKAAFNLLAYVI